MIPTYLSFFMAQNDPFPKLRFLEKARQVSWAVCLKGLTGSKVSEDLIEIPIRLVYLRLPVVHQSNGYCHNLHMFTTNFGTDSLLKKLKNWCIAIGFLTETQETTLSDNRINYIIFIFIKFNLINTNVIMNWCKTWDLWK